MTPDDTHASRPRRSLSVRYVGLILIFVIITGLLLGVAGTLASVRNAALERRRSLEYAAGVVASSLIPVVADQEPERIRAQLGALMVSSDAYDIECIEIRDAAGDVIAETEDGCTCEDVEFTEGLFAPFTAAQVVQVPVEIDGLTVAAVSIQFRPVGLDEVLWGPIALTGVILVLTMIVVSLWGAWVVMHTVVEPIGDLRDAAARIAEGERDIDIGNGRADEIGELAEALEDMTTQLEAQERQLLDSYSSLEYAYEEKDELARRLEHTMSMRSDFVAVASHELRSPLAVIQLYAEMLEDNEFGDLDPELAQAVGSIVSAVGRLGAIVSNMMDVALLERGLMPLNYGEIAMHDVVHQAVTDADGVAAPQGVRVEVDGDIDEVHLRGDPVRLRQAIDNLLSNAIKYSTSPATVSVGMVSSDEWVDVAVTDAGPGIPDDRTDRLFELFGRAETGDDVEVYGLGLGLPISDRIARAHGGSISFHANESGVGTTFVLTLPAGGAPDAAPAAFEVTGDEGGVAPGDTGDGEGDGDDG